MGKIKNLVNHKFGKLKVSKFIGINKHKKATWLCTCSCGKKKIVVAGSLKSGATRSCGCLRNGILIKRNYKHGFEGTRFIRIWKDMKQRCTNPNRKCYKDYGGRGIKLLWKSFEEFRDDMYKGYLKHAKKYGEENTTIDRTNNNGNYCKENCRWATWKEQNKNRKR